MQASSTSNQPSSFASASTSSQSSSSASASTIANFNIYEYKRSRSNSREVFENMLDLSYLDLLDCESSLLISIESNQTDAIVYLLLNNNLLKHISSTITFFQNVETLDLSSNQLKHLSEDICKLPRLKNLIIKDNNLEDTSLPKDLINLQLTNINLSGNLFTQFPYQLLEMNSLREIYLGSNKICMLPRFTSNNLQKLEILYLGGNQIKVLPNELCQLKKLSSLNLSNNLISSLPKCIVKLKNIKNLALHGNQLSTLPVELVKLNLHELSLRNNPLVNRFAKEYSYNVPSLLELSGRVIKIKSIKYSNNNLPNNLVNYLNSAQSCLNPKCKGVYFTSKVEHIKFVDFCGKYRLPLMQYLCSSACDVKVANKSVFHASDSSDSSDSDTFENDQLLKKILIG